MVPGDFQYRGDTYPGSRRANRAEISTTLIAGPYRFYLSSQRIDGVLPGQHHNRRGYYQLRRAQVTLRNMAEFVLVDFTPVPCGRRHRGRDAFPQQLLGVACTAD